MPYEVSENDLAWLEQKGHLVERTPVILEDGRRFHRIDNIPRTEEQIVRYITEGKQMGD